MAFFAHLLYQDSNERSKIGSSVLGNAPKSRKLLNVALTDTNCLVDVKATSLKNTENLYQKHLVYFSYKVFPFEKFLGYVRFEKASASRTLLIGKLIFVFQPVVTEITKLHFQS